MQPPNQFNPQPNDFQPPQEAFEPGGEPQVCKWFRVYCVCFLLLYILVGIGGALIAVFANEIAADSSNPDKETERIGNMITGILMAGISLPLCIVFIVGLMIPRRRWGWIYGFFPIAIGLTSPCCMPASIPLLLFWLKQKNQRWFDPD
jgi:MFS family permease